MLSGATYFPFGAVQGWTWANGQAYRRDVRSRRPNRIADAGSGHGGLRQRELDVRLRQPESADHGDAAAGRDVGLHLRRQRQSQAGNARRRGDQLRLLRGVEPVAGARRAQRRRTSAYDAAGNLTSNGSVTFTYDGRGRLTQTSNGYRYAINGLGQRVSKSGPGGITYFVYDEQGRLIGEYDACGRARARSSSISATRRWRACGPAAGGGVDIYPIYSDHLNTPRLITDQANRIVWEWKTDTFGAGAGERESERARRVLVQPAVSRAVLRCRDGAALQLLPGLRSERREVCGE